MLDPTQSLADLSVARDRWSRKPSGTMTLILSKLMYAASYILVVSVMSNGSPSSYYSSLGSSVHIKVDMSLSLVSGTFSITIPYEAS